MGLLIVTRRVERIVLRLDVFRTMVGWLRVLLNISTKSCRRERLVFLDFLRSQARIGRRRRRTRHNVMLGISGWRHRCDHDGPGERGLSGRRWPSGGEGFATDSKLGSLKDFPVDNAHPDQRNIEGADRRENRVGNIAYQMALIRWTTALVAKDRKEMRTGDENGRHPDDTDQQKNSASGTFRRIIH